VYQLEFDRAVVIVLLLLLYSTYSNWFFLLLSAIWGTGMLLPIAAKGFRGTPFHELVVRLGLISSALAILGAMIVLLVGTMIKTDRS